MTHDLLTFLTIITLALTIGCREQSVNTLPPPTSTSSPVSFAPTPKATPVIPTSTPPRVPPTPSANSTPTPTTAPTPLIVTGWSTFTYNNGSPRISIDYPTGWNVEVLWPSKDLDQLIWAQLYPSSNALTEGINFQVYQFDKRLDPRDPPNPMTEVWCPIPWYRPIATKDADGILSLTCPEASSDPRFISMSSYYYSEKHKLEIYISVPPLAVDATILQSPSITDTISQQYGVYEHMVESVRLIEP